MKKNLRFYIPLLLIVLIALGGSSCKSKKKVSELSDTKTSTQQDKQIAEDDEMEEEEEVKEKTPKKEDAETMVRRKLSDYFSAIASAPSVASANQSINEALNLFESPDALVLIIIYKSADGKKDYDEPTTARNYLNYLKDQKKNPNRIDTIVLNSAGDISELELIKK